MFAVNHVLGAVLKSINRRRNYKGDKLHSSAQGKIFASHFNGFPPCIKPGFENPTERVSQAYTSVLFSYRVPFTCTGRVVVARYGKMAFSIVLLAVTKNGS